MLWIFYVSLDTLCLPCILAPSNFPQIQHVQPEYPKFSSKRRVFKNHLHHTTKKKEKIHFQRSPWRSITHRPGARGEKRGINRRTGRVRVQRGARFDHTPDSGNWVFAAGSHFPSNGRNSWDFQPARKTPIAKERQRPRATVKSDRKNLAFSNSGWLIDTGISRELEPSHRRLPSAPLTFQPDCIVPCTQRSSSRIFPSRLVKHRRVNNSL